MIYLEDKLLGGSFRRERSAPEGKSFCATPDGIQSLPFT